MNRHVIRFWSLMLLTATLVSAQAQDATFRLESMRTRHVYGPFVLRDGAEVALDDASYIVRMTRDGNFLLRAVRTGTNFGPYDFAEGRIILIDGFPYVIVEPGEAPRVATAPAQPAPPPVAPRPSPPPVASPAPPAPRPVRPAPPAPEPTWMDNASLTLFAVIQQSIDYDLDLGAGSPAQSVTIERNSVGASWSALDFFLGVGWLANAEWNRDAVALSETVSQDMDLDDSSGFYLSAGYERAFWRQGPWFAGVRAELLHRSDTYSLGYSVLEEQTSVTYTSNNIPVINAEMVERDKLSDLEITETLVYLGGFGGFRAHGWSAGLRAMGVVIDESSTQGGLNIEGRRLRFNLERQNAWLMTAGLAREFDRFTCFAETDFGGEQALRVGGSYRF